VTASSVCWVRALDEINWLRSANFISVIVL
jgi:hypothetical protein